MKSLFIKPDRTILLALYYDKQNTDKQIEVYLKYDLGGLSYISGNRSKRGYSLHAQPVEICHYDFDGRKVTSKKMTAFTGAFKHLMDAQSFSAQKMMALAARMTELSWRDLLNHVMRQGDLIAEDYILETDA